MSARGVRVLFIASLLVSPALPSGAATVAAVATASGCSMLPGSPAMLASDAIDPDVFVWDSRGRLIDWTGGHWGSSKEVLNHTTLAVPGTRALVVSCAPGVARRKYSDINQDAIGVRLTSGQYKGRYGWVLSSDAHPLGAIHAKK